MKKQTKGLIFLVIFGGSLMFWATASSMPTIFPPGGDAAMTVTGTPADNFPDDQRPQFCGGDGDPGSTPYVTEYAVPTECTQPLAIEVAPDGTVWFAQSNTGRIAGFDPESERFTEYENPSWPPSGRSMVWGLDYLPDGSLWYTDEAHDLVWKFHIDGGRYEALTFPPSADSLPQRLEAHGSRVIVNDFTGGKVAFFDPVLARADAMGAPPSQGDGPPPPSVLRAPLDGGFTGDVAVDGDGYLWFTNWVFQNQVVLVRFDQAAHAAHAAEAGAAPPSPSASELPTEGYVETYQMPAVATTPNGLAAAPDGSLWVMDTSSSYFFRFDPDAEEFTQYVTSDPPNSAFGNASGLIKLPVTRPYWADVDGEGRVIFNEQTANRIAVFDPEEQSLVEYVIPSKNPAWGDCGGLADCGLAQVFGFAIHGEKVWFTEWVENRIGVLDTSVPPPFEVVVDPAEVSVGKGETATVTVTASAAGGPASGSLVTSDTTQFSELAVEADAYRLAASPGDPAVVEVSITPRLSALAADHKVLLGVATGDATVSRYVTVTVLP